MGRTVLATGLAALVLAVTGCGGEEGDERENALTRAVQTGDDFSGLRNDAAPSALDGDGELREGPARCVAKHILDSGMSKEMTDAYIDDRFSKVYTLDNTPSADDTAVLRDLPAQLEEKCNGIRVD